MKSSGIISSNKTARTKSDLNKSVSAFSLVKIINLKIIKKEKHKHKRSKQQY